MSSNYLKNKSLCPLPFAGAIVHPDGSVQCCSISKEKLGNVNDQPLNEILSNSKKFERCSYEFIKRRF